MITIINTILQRNKPIYVKRERVESFLTFELIEFMDINSVYCQMFIAYNKTNVYCINKKLLCSTRGHITDLITSAIKKWTTKEEFIAEKMNMQDKKVLDAFGNFYIQEIKSRVENTTVADYKCKEVFITTNPVATILIHYNKKGRRQQTLKAFIGEILYIKYIDESFKIFVESCYADYCEIVWIN